MPMAGPDFMALGEKWGGPPARIGGSVKMIGTYGGHGVSCVGSTSAFTVGYQAPSMTAPLSVECLFYSGAATNTQSICGFNLSNDGSNGSTFDKTLRIDPNGFISSYIFSGGQQFLADTTLVVPNRIYHVVFTIGAGGTNSFRMYVDSVNVANSTAGPSFNLGSPLFFCVGVCAQGSIGVVPSPATILLANVADVVWTPNEVMERAKNPWAFLDFPDDDLFAELVGAAPAFRSRSLFVA